MVKYSLICAGVQNGTPDYQTKGELFVDDQVGRLRQGDVSTPNSSIFWDWCAVSVKPCGTRRYPTRPE